MKTSIKAEIKEEVFAYLNSLITNKLYPYMFQTRGKYQAKRLHMEIEVILNQILEKNFIYDEDYEWAAQEICELIDKELNSYILEKATGNIYLLDFNVFSTELSAKIKNFVFKHKNIENSFDKKPINKKLAL